MPDCDQGRMPWDESCGKPAKEKRGPHNELIRHVQAEWLRTRMCEYAVQVKDAVNASRILKLNGVTLDEAKRRATIMLEHTDGWVIENASISELLARWNRYGVRVVRREQLTAPERSQKNIQAAAAKLREYTERRRQAREGEIDGRDRSRIDGVSTPVRELAESNDHGGDGDRVPGRALEVRRPDRLADR